MADIVADDGSVAAIRHIDSVLIDGVQTLIVFQQQVVRKPGENAALEIVITIRIAYDAMVGQSQSDSITRLIDDPYSIDLDIVGILDVDAVHGDRVMHIDDDIRSSSD